MRKTTIKNQLIRGAVIGVTLVGSLIGGSSAASADPIYRVWTVSDTTNKCATGEVYLEQNGSLLRAKYTMTPKASRYFSMRTKIFHNNVVKAQPAGSIWETWFTLKRGSNVITNETTVVRDFGGDCLGATLVVVVRY